MGKHEYRGVRAQRAMNLAAARKADKEKLNRLKYGYPVDPGHPEFYPRALTRPTTPRPASAGLAMRRAEARDVGLVVGPVSDEKPKETVRSTSWKYLHTCVGVMAGVMVGIGLLVGITSHWTTSRAGQAGIGLICGGAGIVVAVIIFAYIRLKHAKMQEKRREAKQAKGDVEAGKKEGKGVQFKQATTAQDVPMRPITAKKKRKKRKPVEEKEIGDTDSCTSRDSMSNEETTSDTADIVPRSSSRTSMNLQGSINMSSIPEDEEDEDHGAAEGPASSPRSTTTNEDQLDKDSLPGIIVTSETKA